MNTWFTENGKLHNNVYVPDEAITRVVRRETQRTAPVAHHRDLSKLAHAGLFGFIALAVIAIVAGVLAILPKPLRIFVILAAIGWLIWSVATYKPPQEASSDVAPRAELVRPPEPEVRRAILVNPHPNHR